MRLSPIALAGIAVGSLLANDSVHAQTLGGAEAIEIPFLRIFAGLALSVLIALGAALVLKRKGGGGLAFGQLLSRQLSNRAPRRIRVHETYRLSPHADLCRFTAGSKEYVVILSPNSTHVLSVSDDASETAAIGSAAPAAS